MHFDLAIGINNKTTGKPALVDENYGSVKAYKFSVEQDFTVSAEKYDLVPCNKLPNVFKLDPKRDYE